VAVAAEARAPKSWPSKVWSAVAGSAVAASSKSRCKGSDGPTTGDAALEEKAAAAEEEEEEEEEVEGAAGFRTWVA
jgi:ribosomal protein L12E/L44/L45/RPP1/RPP2